MRNTLAPKTKRPIALLVLCLLALLVLLFIFFFISPSSAIDIFGFQIGMLVFFFPLLFIFTFSLLAFLFKRKTHGILAGVFVVIYLVLRINGFTHPLFLLLLLALLLIFEMLFMNKTPDSTPRHPSKEA